MSMKVEVSGPSEAVEKLGMISEALLAKVHLALTDSVLEVHSRAVKSIQAHQSEGRTYNRGNIAHTASAPGNPPNSDTGNLVQHIGFEVDDESLTGVVGTNLLYGKYLELGTTTIQPRPWLFPAFEEYRSKIMERLENVTVEAIKEGSNAG